MARPSAELHPSSCISTSRKRPRDDADLLELDASYSSSWSWRTPGSLPVVLPTSWSGVLSRKRTKTRTFASAGAWAWNDHTAPL